MTARVALLCIDPWEDPGGDSPQFRPFDYSVRRVEAALRARAPELEVRLFERSDDDVEALHHELRAFAPDVVGASAFVWSFPTFVELARRLAVESPRTTTIFGGPSARPAMLDLEPYRDARACIDALVVGEGEEVFPEAVVQLARGGALDEVPGLHLWTGHDWRSTGERAPPDLDLAPSPYTLGLVPPRYSGHLESFRGCPLACAFCQWGDSSGQSRVFSVDALVRELEAMRAADVLGVWLVDAALNLNARAFRNLREAERRVGLLRERHFHAEVYPAHLTSEHLDFLGEIEGDAVGIGLQSYDREVLRRLGRPFDERRFETVVKDALSIVPSVHIELIMGLPGDHPDAFRRTLDRARELGADLRIYHCLVLPDALMTRAPAGVQMRFDPHTLAMRDCTGWTEDDFARLHEELDDAVREGGYASRGTGSWTLTRKRSPTHTRDDARRTPEVASVDPTLAQAVLAASQGRFRLARVERRDGTARFSLDTDAGPLVLDVRRVEGDARAFVVVDGIGISYQVPPSGGVPEASLSALSACAPTLAPVLATALAPRRVALPVAG